MDKTVKYHYANVASMILFSSEIRVYRLSPHAITAGHLTTFTWKFLFLDPKFVQFLGCQIGLCSLFPFFNTTLPLIMTGRHRQAL